MKRFVIVLAATLVAAVAFAVAPAVTAPAKPIPVSNLKEKGVVTFDHAKHAATLCVSCHHKAAEGKYKCGECHGAEEKGATPTLKNAAHGKDKGACYACHLKPEAPNKKKCADCHAG